MKNNKIEKSILRYLNGAASRNDLDVLNEWIKDPLHLEKFKDYLKTHFAINLGMNNQDITKMKESLLKEIRNEKQKFRVQRRRNAIFKYAAVLIVMVGLFYYYGDQIFISQESAEIVSGEEMIILERENGEVEVLQNDGSIILTDNNGNTIGKQNGEELIYAKKKSATELVYNTLKIPYGKQLKIKLSDGTKIMLNAGSEFKYPVNFIDGKKRQVFLEGEAYFDVAHDSLHPFVVAANSLNIQVLGTKFNVANYREDISTEVVLVGGSVLLKSDHSEEEGTLLAPGQKGIFKKSENKIQTKEVNTSIYTSWTDGLVVFRKAPFQNIVKKLERHYNVKIHNTNADLAKEKFNATIDVESESLEQVLEYFNRIYGIDYRIINNEINIK
ncbi:FecR domain-containing protein [Gramella sp. MAR_2010_147]|uniref:FecR family protein n=1 Tax=Gramella sp. MAR_2010_147 TaxID=1250205 RepID=UPI00087B8146|nr:FecR domain-containing protein [Gramella sp. MAR_2010_147]SDS63990.1 FecR protein [Gramella sp. MAR_2010_147]